MTGPRGPHQGQFVLSLFPGIGLLDMAFEEEGFCVVRGPDLLWGGDIRRFHPPAGKFDGVIGGPPCQKFTGFANFAHRWKWLPEDLIPEFERVVDEADPSWFLMENVPLAPIPAIEGYNVTDRVTRDDATGGVTSRTRRFSFGVSLVVSEESRQLGIEELALYSPEPERTVTNHNGGRTMPGGGPIDTVSISDALRRQGLPADFFEFSPFSVPGQRKMLANGVPLPMGRAVARAVKRALGLELDRTPRNEFEGHHA